MTESIFSQRLQKVALKYGHEVMLERGHRAPNKSKPTLTDSSLLAPDRGSTADESIGILRYVIKSHPDDLIGQVHNFFKLVDIPAASGAGSRKGRKVSHSTLERYYQTVTLMIQELRNLNIKPLNMGELSYKHMTIIIKHWEKKQLSSSTISNRYSVLKRFYMMIGKDHAPPLRSILDNPLNASRSQASTRSLEWKSNGVDAESIIELIEKEDARVAVTLKMCLYFGLRVKEAASFMPNTNVHESVILINKGSKGGRSRVVDIENDIQRKVLNEAKQLAHPRTGCIGQSRSLTKNINHIYSVVRNYGITKERLGVTIHGLRHSYLNAVYEAITGVKSPINGGGPVEKQLDLQARLEVSRRAGHSRPGIASAYVGTHRHLSNYQRNQLIKTIQSIESNPNLVEAFNKHKNTMRATGCEIELCITGPHALGQPGIRGANILFGLSITKDKASSEQSTNDFGYQAYSICLDLERLLTEVLEEACTVKEMSRFPSNTDVLALKLS